MKSPAAKAKWIVSRSVSRDLLWHIQARTSDQLSSFAMVVGEAASILRHKAADGVTDVFTLTSDMGHGTMNVFGEIQYVGTWPS